MSQVDRPRMLALDTGGTMTDAVLVNNAGDYMVGKAQTTPADESEGIINSFSDALGYWDYGLAEGAPALEKIVYSGTAMLNRLVEREGDENIGVITNKGFEDTHKFGRGLQAWVGHSYAGRLHAREHEHPEPIVPRENVRGVRGRIDQAGNQAIPLYESEAREVVTELLEMDVDIICVCLLHSYKNSTHEEMIKEIAQEVQSSRADETPVWLSSEQNPIRGELPRLNSLLIEAYAVEPSRKQFDMIRSAFGEQDADAPLRILTGGGETISPDHDWLVDTMISGPVGGMFGAEYLGEQLDFSNTVCTDVGGTSFEAGLITEGHYPTRWDHALSQFMVNIPLPVMDTIGSGTGSFVSIDENSNRLDIGPKSAGSEVGIANVDSDLDTPTVTDCSAILGYLNPDFFLGGDIDLDLDHARSAIEDEVASPLNQDVHETARGVLDVVEQRMMTHLKSMVYGQGYSPENYKLLCYGGGGPLHVAGYTKDLEFEDVLIPEWAAAFSAFGCACADYAYRYDQTVDFQLEPGLRNDEEIASAITDVLLTLRDKAISAFEDDNVDPDQMEFQPVLHMQYTGMEDDIEIEVPREFWDGALSANDLSRLVDIYQHEFQKVFKRSAQSPEKGYMITTITAKGIAPSTKPVLPEEDPVSETTPPESAYKGERDIFWEESWRSADVWNMNEILAGNTVEGPSIIEAPATTMLIPPGYSASLDHRRMYHLEQEA
jgi:acetone carboxylase beta subunit